MQGLTKRQREIVDFIEGFLVEKKYSPSYRDIQRHFSFNSLGSVYNHIQSLKKKGILPQDTTRSRSLLLAGKNKSGSVDIPLIGMLRGGMPIETYQHMTEISLAEHMVSLTEPCYLLRVVGNELQEEWIQEGDLLLIRSSQEFVNGALVLAQVGKQTTFVKRAAHESPYIRLHSMNPIVQPMILQEDHVEILGVIIALMRDYSS